MTDQELIARLRDAKRDWPEFGHDRAEAADRLAAQAAEIERLEKACAEWAEVSQSNYQRAKAAEAKLAKAVENTLDAASAYMTEQYGISALSHPVDRARAIATLAEIKGESHD